MASLKLLIASDIHGSAHFCNELIARITEEKPDIVMLLGDLLYHGPRNALPEGYDPRAVADMLNDFKDSIVAVRGNCDAEVDQMVLAFPCMADYTTIIDDEGRMLYATHGHLRTPETLPPLAPGSAFLSGHTHIKQLEERNGITLVNPGSVSIPKDGRRGYALYDNGAFRLKALDGTTLQTL